MGHHPGIPHMAQAPPAATRPAVPATTVSTPQTNVSKPLFPSAGQVCSPMFFFNDLKCTMNSISKHHAVKCQANKTYAHI